MNCSRDFPGIQWLGLYTSTAGDMGSILGWIMEILQAARCGKKTKQKTEL